MMMNLGRAATATVAAGVVGLTLFAATPSTAAELPTPTQAGTAKPTFTTYVDLHAEERSGEEHRNPDDPITSATVLLLSPLAPAGGSTQDIAIGIRPTTDIAVNCGKVQAWITHNDILGYFWNVDLKPVTMNVDCTTTRVVVSAPQVRLEEGERLLIAARSEKFAPGPAQLGWSGYAWSQSGGLQDWTRLDANPNRLQEAQTTS